MASDYFDDSSWSGIDDDQWGIDSWKGSGYRMIWGVPMLPTSGGYTLAAGATGAYNSYFTILAKNLVAAGMGDAVLRVGWEFNTSGNPWYAAGQAPAFVAYWQQIVTTMRAVSGANFSFEWNVNLGGLSDAAMDSYYPGNNYVDIIGMDVYDIAWDTYPGAAANFQDILTQPGGLDWLASFASANDKPVALPEWGLGWDGSGDVSGGDDPIFINDIANWISNNDVVNAVFWDYGSSSIANNQNPLTMSALEDDFGTAG
jgi:beta-mannanase